MTVRSSFTVLVVDDEPDVVDALRRALRSPRLSVIGCTRPGEALEIVAAQRVDMVISDLDMPDMHGLELLRRVRRDHPEVVRIVLTGRASLESALEAINQGEVQRYLTKPWDGVVLRRTVDEALDRLAEIRWSADAARRVSAREQIERELERSYPGITHVELEDGVVVLDAKRLDAAWSLRDVEEPQAAPGEPLERLSGVVLDQRFLLEEPIGKGGFGVVYRALQLSLDRFVAVKVLRSREPGRAHLKRFRLEALSTCRVVHPNAVTVLDAGIDDKGMAYLVMELLTGETVSQRLRRGETLTFDAAAQLGADLCDALGVAHESGILHRDVKPANVFLHDGPTGTVVKLLDFGIAKLVLSRGSSITADDLLVGTPAYMAPERMTHGDVVDGRVDVYSVGVLLYEALSGSRPFHGESATELARQQLHVHPRPLREIDPSVPAELDAIVSRMIDKDPAARPTARGVATELRALSSLPSEHMRRAASASTDVSTVG